MRCRGCGNGYFLACECSVVEACVETVGWLLNCAYNSAVISLCDVVGNLLTFKSCDESLYDWVVLVTLLYGENVAVSGSRALNHETLLYGVKACADCVVGVDYGVVDVLKDVRNLCCFHFLECDAERIGCDVGDCGSDAGVVVNLDNSVCFEEEQCACFVCGIVWNSDCDFLCPRAGSCIGVSAACSEPCEGCYNED